MIEGPSDRLDPSAELLARWQESGDRDALDEMLRIEIGILKVRIRAKGRGAAGPAMSVSDVAQDAVMRLLRVDPAPRFDTPEAMRAYLWLSAWRLLAGQLRRPGQNPIRIDATQSSRLDGSLATGGGQSTVDRQDRDVALELAVNLLDPNEQEILDLVYFRDLGIDGAAQHLGVNHGAAKMRLVRARRSLAKRLAGWTELIE